MHYAKGQRAKNHKYIDIVNGRYIYSEDKGSRSKIDTTKSQNRVNTNYGYHVRAKQINAYLAKENGDNSVWVAGKSVGAKKESPFKKNVRKSQKLKNNSLYESHKQLIKGNLEPRRDHVKAKAKSLISNSKSSRFDSLLSKLSSGKSKVSSLLNTSMKALRGAGSTVRRKAQSAAIKFRNRNDQDHDVITWFTQPKQTVHKGREVTISTRSGLGANRKRGVYASSKSR